MSFYSWLLFFKALFVCRQPTETFYNKFNFNPFQTLPEWANIKDPHPNYPSASSAITVKVTCHTVIKFILIVLIIKLKIYLDYSWKKNLLTFFSCQYDPLFGRHVVANRTIEVGEVIFNEEPIVCVSKLGNIESEIVATPVCHHCLRYIRSGLVPCPTCNIVSFCRLV